MKADLLIDPAYAESLVNGWALGMGIEEVVNPPALVTEIGTAKAGTPHPVLLDTVLRYADAIGEAPDRIHAEGLVPPVFAMVASISAHGGLLVNLVPHALLPASVHLGQLVEFVAPIHVGDVVTSRASLAEVRSTPFGCSLTLAVEVFTNDAVAATAYHRVLLRGVKAPASGGRVEQPKRPRSRPGAAVLGEMEFAVADDQSQRYAVASKDYLAIHTDVEVARRAGFEGLILHGMCTLAFAAQAAARFAADGDSTRVAAMGCTFTRPVVCGRPVTVTVRDGGDDAVVIDARQGTEAVIRDAWARIGPASSSAASTK